MLKLLSCLLLATVVIAQPEPGEFGLTFPDENTLRTYAGEANKKELLRLESEGKGRWTIWMDRDFPMPWGTGEFENVLRERVDDYKRGQCHMWCDHPLAMELRIAEKHENKSTSDLQTVLRCPATKEDVYNPDVGYTCHNFAQGSKNPARCDFDTCMKNGLGSFCEFCPDMAVRYFCTGRRNCMPAAKRSLGDMREEMVNKLGAEAAEDMMITLDAWNSPKRQLIDKRAMEQDKKAKENDATDRATDLLKRLLEALKSEQ